MDDDVSAAMLLHVAKCLPQICNVFVARRMSQLKRIFFREARARFKQSEALENA